MEEKNLKQSKSKHYTNDGYFKEGYVLTKINSFFYLTLTGLDVG
jgi:hypothetical protein